MGDEDGDESDDTDGAVEGAVSLSAWCELEEEEVRWRVTIDGDALSGDWSKAPDG